MWYESASLAAALEDAHKSHMGQSVQIRMMRHQEVRRFFTWDDKYTEAVVMERAHLHREGVMSGTASVVGEAARQRTTREGFVDAFGNVGIWTGSTSGYLDRDDDIGTVVRKVRGASWASSPQTTHVAARESYHPRFSCDDLGVRWAAIFRNRR
jgi:formylglycine-generating enzyme required for sulfatase activity